MKINVPCRRTRRGPCNREFPANQKASPPWRRSTSPAIASSDTPTLPESSFHVHGDRRATATLPPSSTAAATSPSWFLYSDLWSMSRLSSAVSPLSMQSAKTLIVLYHGGKRGEKEDLTVIWRQPCFWAYAMRCQMWKRAYAPNPYLLKKWENHCKGHK